MISRNRNIIIITAFIVVLLIDFLISENLNTTGELILGLIEGLIVVIFIISEAIVYFKKTNKK